MIQDEKPLKLLVAESDTDQGQSLCAVLKQLGYDPLPAQNGAEVMILVTQHPDIALLLLYKNLPGVDAITLLKKLRQQQNNIPAVILSDTSGKAEIIEAVSSGASDFIVKPYQIGRLMLKINTILERCQDQLQERMQPTGLDLECSADLVLLDISATGCAFKSSFPMQENSYLLLESNDITSKLQVAENTSFPIRIANCTQQGKGWKIGAQFVGLCPTIKEKLAAACQSHKGFTFK